MKIKSKYIHICFCSVCPSCNFKSQNEPEAVTVYDIIEVGLPICQECGEELEVMDYAEVEKKQYQS